MSRVITFVIIAAVFLCVVGYIGAAAVGQRDANNTAVSASAINVARPKMRVDSVTVADFYLRDGSTVSGRLLSEDNTQVVVELVEDSTLVTKTYSKREVDTRTLRTRPVLENLYYTQLGEYFAARTWDFRDDPDDFIQAIRCYEKAKQSLQAGGVNGDRVAEIDKAIKKLEEDREVWTAQVESRAKLRKLEYEAEAENRLKQLERQVVESNESIKNLSETADNMKGDYDKLEETVTGLNKDYAEQLRILQNQIRENQVAINEIWVQLNWCCRFRAPAPGGG